MKRFNTHIVLDTLNLANRNTLYVNTFTTIRVILITIGVTS